MPMQLAPVQRQEEEDLAVGEEEEDQLHAGRMRLDQVDQGVPLLASISSWLKSLSVGCGSAQADRRPASQQALDW